MKPCADQQKLIALLALHALPDQPAHELLAHLKTCDGCHRYLAELSLVTEQLSAVQPDSEVVASETFHRQTVARLKAETSESVWNLLLAVVRDLPLLWRVTVPASVILLIWLRLGITNSPPADVPVQPVASIHAPATATTAATADQSPTIANYQRVADESLDKLDELLSQQEKQTARATPVYTASASSLTF
jgi:hypothetical protein